jgi:RHH-type rel operon transcriptional repressor/antitoxin RelB
MAESPIVGARVPQDWQQQIQAIARASGRKEAEIVREALGQYLGKTDLGSVKGANRWFAG